MSYESLLSEIIKFNPISDMFIEKAKEDYNSPLDDFHAELDYFLDHPVNEYRETVRI
ncbi:MAG: hypothetical protein K8R45_15740 [Desulfobacterales bacterium]|nr:hypothetical protein [Desulfobacterales bacterium]